MTELLTIIAIVGTGVLCTLLPDSKSNEKEDDDDDEY